MFINSELMLSTTYGSWSNILKPEEAYYADVLKL